MVNGVNGTRVILATVVIFLAGGVTGGIVVRTYAPKVVKRTHVSPPLPISHDRRQEYIAKLDRELELTDEQQVKIEQILAASQKRMKQIWEPFEPQVKEEYRRTRREIFEVLTPEQQVEMKSWRKWDNKGEKKGDGENRSKDAEKSQKPMSQADEKQKCCARRPLLYCF